MAVLLQAALPQSVWYYREPVVTGLDKKVAVLYNTIDCDGSAVFVLFGCFRYAWCMVSIQHDAQNPNDFKLTSSCWITHRNV